MSESKIEYTTRKSSVLSVLFLSMGGKESRKALFGYLKTVMRDFFFLQFSVKFGFKHIPILNVDHPLDKTVPFTPEKVSVYLDFVAFWIRPLSYIARRFGKALGRRYTAEFLALVDLCYRDAAEVYRYRMTTTKRPRYFKGKFLAIHMFDPHFLCVPSLHVIIVVLAYTFYRRVFSELNMGEEEKTALNDEMFKGAVEITETVLYIKQHSVNCIPAALYAMNRITPNDVSPTEVINFIDHLFIDAPAVTKENAIRIREYISEIYEELFLEGFQDAGWTGPLQRWLNAYSLEGFIY